MERTNTHLRYLLAIDSLSRTGEGVRSSEVAASLGVSKPSVARMVGILAEQGLIEKARYGKIALTEQGADLARTYQARIRKIAERIPALGLDLSEEEASRAAGALADSLPERCFTGAGEL